MSDPSHSYVYRLVYGLDNFPAIEKELRRLGVQAEYIDMWHARFYRVAVSELPKLGQGTADPYLPTGRGGGYLFHIINDDDPLLNQGGVYGRGWKNV